MKNERVDCVEIDWVDPDNSLMINQGVTLIGYFGDALIGYNEIIIGDLVSVKLGHAVLQSKYDSIRRSRLSNELDRQENYLGQIQPKWSYVGPWRIVEITQDGSFGITQRTDSEHADILVRADQVVLYGKTLRNGKDKSS